MNDLEHLMAAYFHQDWDDEYGTWTEAVDDFLARSPERAATIPAAISELLGAFPQDGDLDRRLGEIGCAHDPAEGDRAWLLAVRAHIAATLARRNHP